MLNFIYAAVCRNQAHNTIMSVVMLNVIMLSVVAASDLATIIF